jgi:uncharacterized repeat protein (TIGR01451 family)
MSRGSLLRVNPRTRKSITLSWVVLFVLSLLLQYAQLATPKSTLAVHDLGLFELDGNAVNPAAAGDDWDATPGAQSTQFIHDVTDAQNDDSFTGGSTKDDLPLTGWLWKQAKVGQPKNDIADAFAAAYTDNNGDTVAYFGLDKIEADGNNFVGFWFFKNPVGKTGSGAAPGSHFSGNHTVGDILVLANYTNGGSVAGFDVFKWVGSGGNVNGTLQTVENGGECGTEANDDACGKTNANLENSPWTFQGRDTAPNKFGPGTFFEGGINLSALDLDTGCFTTFLAETRSSQSVDATLSDFALGEFSFCEKPELATSVNDQSITIGGSVTDTATLTGTKGTVTGTIEFFVCGPSASNPDCSSGGTKVGVTKTLAAGAATSDAFTPDAVGHYCFRAEYTPTAGSHYLATSHTNLTTECFNVTKKQPAIVTSADEGVTAGETISDSATLSGATSDAGGTITFVAYIDAACSTAVFTSAAVAVSGNGTYGPVSFTPSAAGTYHWIASYSGDAKNLPVAGPCGAAGENDQVTKLRPSITTSLVGGGQNGASITVGLGAAVHDTANLHDATADAGGTVTYAVFDNDECAGDPFADAGTKTVVNGVVPDSNAVIFDETGTFYWQATYSGDANNEAATSSCKSEIVTVSSNIPSIGTTASAGILLGAEIHDTAHLNGTFNGTGTITFKLYGPDDTNCTGSVIFQDTVDVHGNGDYDSDPFEPDAAGVYRWIASYSGDSNNAAVSGACNDPNENVTVRQPTLTILKTVAGNSLGTDPILGVPAAKVGDNLLYTLAWTLTSGPVHNAVITDVLPTGMTAPTNISNGGVYVAATNTITWNLGTRSDPTGSVTYHVIVTAADAALPQPLVNVATIDSDETEPDSDDASVAIQGQVEEASPTPTPRVTPPNTATDDVSGTPGGSGFNLQLILFILGAVTLVGFLTPTPATVRRRGRRG